MYKGIDISHWQKSLDFEKAINNGVEFMIFKGTDSYIGNCFIDSKALEYIEGAKSYGVPFGIYMWLNPNFDGETQADFFIDFYKKVKPDIAPVVDFEQSSYDLNKDLYYLKTVLERMEDKLNTKPIIYSRNSFINRYNRNKRSFLREYYYWAAWYPYKDFETKSQYKYFENLKTFPKPIYPFEEVTIWQFSEKGDGIFYGVKSFGVDLDLAKQLPPSNYIDTFQPKKVMITARLGLRVREEPNLSSKIIKVLPYKTIVEIQQEQEKFYKIKEGYIYKYYTKEI